MKPPSTHRLARGDARQLDWIRDGSIHLVLTSPPYWTLKRYNERPGQLGHVTKYEGFLDELDKVWSHCYRVLVPGGRLVCVVGDVCISRRQFGRHLVMPLHADIVVRARGIGFDNLTPILWHKIANASYEVENGSSFLGKPYEPNAIVKNDIEYILMLRKPGGYRSPTPEQRQSSKLSTKEYQDWFRAFWTDVSGTSSKIHPAPFPITLAYRLIRMFSFVGDTVLDPFAGSLTTSVAALRTDRNSISNELDVSYIRAGLKRLRAEASTMAIPAELIVRKRREESRQLNDQIAPQRTLRSV